MKEDSLFDLGPEQLSRLLLLGSEEEQDHVSKPQPGPGPVPPGVSVAGVVEQPGGWIGRYKLLGVLGEGGMGIVYLAEQTVPMHRQVALKVIKPGMDSHRVIARFEAERQALALLDHPNIAHIYDAGTTDSGRPYFVMEYVDGLPITAHCDHHRLSIEERLRLFQQVCLAVHHAHQKGIIHRDLKPSNILVSAEDDRPVPKIIDFGVAKAISQPLTERTVATEDSHLLGTPEYMSPEQADMTSEDIDTRSDIYSLGVLLYVLLAGILPYDSETFRQGGIEHIRNMIRETDPKTPSTRLAKLGEQAKKLAESRRTEVGALTKRLHAELEWIPLKAMRKERAERYRSASEMADDVENYLTARPLIAGPPGTIYRLKKSVRRHKALVAGVTAVLVALVAGVAASTTFAIGQARALAENQLISDFLKNDVLGAASKARVEEASVGYILDAASKSLEDKFQGRPLVEASLHRTLGETYRMLGEYQKAEEHLLRAAEIYREHVGEEHPDTLGAMSNLGWVYLKEGRHRDMERLWTKVLAVERRVSDVRQQVYTMNGLAVTYCAQGRYKEAEALFDEMMPMVQQKLGGESFGLFPTIKANLANLYRAQGRYEEAERLLLELAEDGQSAGSHILAYGYFEQGRYQEAEALCLQVWERQRQLRGDEHVDTLAHLCALIELYVEQGRCEEAQTRLDEALPIARRLLRADQPLMLRLVCAYAMLHTKRGQYDQADTLFDEALKGVRRERGDDHPGTLATVSELGVLRREQQRYDEAESLLRQALEGRQRKLGSDHPACFKSMHELAVLYMRQARYEEAEPLLLEAFRGREIKLGPACPHTLASLKRLVTLYESWGKPDEAKKWRATLVK